MRTGKTRLLEAKESSSLACLLAEAFSEDEKLRTLKYFKKEEFPNFFHLAVPFFTESKNWLALGYFEEGNLAGAALGIPSNWTASPLHLWRFFLRAWKVLSWRTFPMSLRLLESAWLSRPHQACFRLLFLGVSPSFRSKGIGRELLRELDHSIAYPFIQLEVEEKNNKAVTLYLSEGYEIVKRYRIRDVYWLVMVKALTQEKEPV